MLRSCTRRRSAGCTWVSAPAADLAEALEKLGARRLLVEAMAASGVDLIVGARRDPVSGLLSSSASAARQQKLSRMSPYVLHRCHGRGRGHARRAVGSRSARRLAWWARAGPVGAGTRRACARCVLLATPNVDEIEINPLRLTSDGLVALDAVITGKEQQ